MVGEGLSRQEAEVSEVIFAVTNMKGRIRPRCFHHVDLLFFLQLLGP